jgi:hypothetical protein
VPRVAFERGQVFEIARIRELVEIDDGLAGFPQPVEHEVGADETGAAGDEYFFGCRHA